LIRKTPVAPTPEEQVRQALLSFMIDKAGYPKGLIGVELSLSSLPQLKSLKLPKRRADLLVFSSTMTPLVLIECKAVPLTKATIRQVVGYNLFIKAPYIVIANHEEIQTGTFNGTDWIFLPGMPNYSDIKHP
jgi:hypothetical protein